MLSQVLFETKLGQKTLEILERRANLAIVSADWLGGQESGLATARNGNQAMDKKWTPHILVDYTTAGNDRQQHAFQTRRLLLALNWYPPADARGQEPRGLAETLCAMLERLDPNDLIAVWQVASRLYGTVPSAGFWEWHERLELPEEGAKC